MTKNVGKTDRVLRLIIAAALFVISLAASIGAGLKAVLLVFAAVALLTAVFGF